MKQATRLGRSLGSTTLAQRRLANVLRCTELLFSLLLVCGASSTVAGQDAVPEPVEPRQLAEQNYSARQQATLEMWRRRDLSRDEVQAASRDSDPEVASRAQWILRQWRRGALPDTPADVSRLLGRTDDPTAIEELLDAGQLGAAVVAVEESAGTADRDAVRMRAVVSLQRRFPIYAVRSLRDGTLPDLLKLVDLVADSKEMALTRIELMQKLGLEFDDASLLPDAASKWSKAERDQARVLVYASLGRHDEAIRAAKESRDESLMRVSRMLDSRWGDIASESVARARTAMPGSLEQTRYWCEALVGADRAELDDIRSEAITALVSKDAARGDLALDLRWKCLASHGEVDAALELLRTKDVSDAALVAIAASRSVEAFEWLGSKDGAIGAELETRIDDALTTQATALSSEPVAELEQLLALMRCLLSVGRSDLAWMIADTLARSPLQIGNGRVRDLVLQSLSMTRRDDWVLRLAVLPGEDNISATSQRAVVSVLKDADQGTLKTLIEAYRRLYPHLPVSERFQAVCALVNGESPTTWNRATDFQRLYDELTTGKKQIQRVGGQAVIAVTPQLNLNIVELFGRHGETELANKALQRMVGLGDVQAAFQLAENQLASGRAHTAESLYDSIIAAITAQRSNRQSAIGATGTDLATKSLVAKWILAKRSADPEAAARLAEEIRIALCSPSTELRHETAQYLNEHGETEFASEIYATLLPMTAFGTREGTEFYDVANHFASLVKESDVGQAARWFDLAVGGTLESVYFREVAYVTLPLYVSRWNLEAAVKSGETAAVERHLHRIEQLNRLDIDTAERVFPKLAAAGMQGIVDKALAEMIRRGEKYLTSFPLDATMYNNLAWVTSINGMELEKAKAWSTWAVYFEPDSAVYRDTLAEALFRVGEVDQALLVEQACLLDEPGEWHLHEQIERFKEAKIK